jgi:site-specific DNA-methyltransferase (adenine-specific)
MVDAVLFSAKTNEWATPQAFFDRLDAEFHFTLDPCATAENAKCISFHTKSDDGLSLPWPGRVFVNPPYGRAVGLWVSKSYWESQTGSTIVMLIPSRTDTRYWHDYVMKASEIRFVRGRLRFGGAKNSAPFPSAVIVFHPWCRGPPVVSAMWANGRPAQVQLAFGD